MQKTFLLFILIIYGFLFLGYGMKRANAVLEGFSRPLAVNIMIFLTPVIILNAFWSLDFSNLLITQLPLIYVLIISVSILPALLIGKLLKLDPGEKGSFTACTMFSNVGITLGGFLCFILFGDEGLYISNLYTAFFIPYYYLIGFPLMRALSGKKNTRYTHPLHELVATPASIVPISFMTIGLILNLAGVRRPELLNTLVSRPLMYISAAGNSFAIGLGLRFMQSLRYVRHSVFICAVKFFLNPIVGFALLYLFGFLKIENPVPAKVVLIESFMPTAIMSVVMVKLFELNEDLANSAWILSNLAVIPMIPVMVMLSGLL